MVASCAGAALGCYLVSLRVASERAALDNVEAKIVSTQGDLRLLQTEIGTRGRLSQLERWNAGAFALSAPAANQFVQSSFELARLVEPLPQPNLNAPVVLASAAAPAPKAPLGQAQRGDYGAPTAADQTPLLHQASLNIGTREVPAKAVVVMPKPTAGNSADRPVTAAKPVLSKSVDKPGLAAANAKKSVDKPALATVGKMTKRVQLAKTDPLAPLPAKHSDHRDAPTGR